MVHFWTWDQLRLFGPLHTRLALERIHRGRPTTRAEVVGFDRHAAGSDPAGTGGICPSLQMSGRRDQQGTSPSDPK